MFWHILSLALGKSVEECQQSMRSDEFARWMTIFRMYKFTVCGQPIAFESPKETDVGGFLAAMVRQGRIKAERVK